MELKDLCMNLARAERENQVISILSEAGYWDDETAWQYYGRENVWGIASNQQAAADAALVEKIVNSVDAMLLLKCELNNIDPLDYENAPKSINEAVEQFYKIRRGSLEELKRNDLSKLSDDIRLVATGLKTRPCFHIIDRGEGQTPKMFPKTFVSVSESNKVRIPFVQGKFHQGGTGAIVFCGDHGLQLIVSKKHPKLAEKLVDDSTSTHWGFTVTRVFPPTKTMLNPVVKYLAPNNEIPSFPSKSLPLLPGKHPEPFGENLEWGTFVKLYEYQMTQGYASDIRRNLFFRLSFRLPKIALPVRMHERREYGTERHETTLSGLVVRLKQRVSKKSPVPEEGFPDSGQITLEGHPLKYTIYLFKGELSKAYVEDEGIAIVLDGQTQAWFTRALFSMNKNLGYIAKSLLVLIDCTPLPRSITTRLFMGSRDRLRVTNRNIALRNAIMNMLEDHPKLREINNRRRAEAMQKERDDPDALRSAVERLLKRSPGLNFILNPGQKLHNPFDITGKDTQDEKYPCERWPTRFDMISKVPKEVPRGNRFRISFETNACNDYFSRGDYPGSFSLNLDGLKPDYRLTLWNGKVNLTVMPTRGVKVGDNLEFLWEVKDKFFQKEGSFHITITEPSKKQTESGKSAKPPSDKDGNKRKGPKMLDLPEVREFGRSEYEGEDDDFTALKVVPSPEGGFDFWVNMDNYWLNLEALQRRSIKAENIKSQFKWGMAFLGMAILQKDKRVALDLGVEKSPDELVKAVSRAVAPALIMLMNDIR